MGIYQPDTLGSQLFQARMKSHDALQEHLKQVIVIASATLALTITFLKDVVGSEGERATFVWAMPFSWGFLGASIFFSIITIAVLVNNLDWAAEPRSIDLAGKGPTVIDESYAVGARFKIYRWVLLSFGSFGLGMALLGLFAAGNYKLFLHRAKIDYKINSASEAVDQARMKLPGDATQVQVSKAELIKGVTDLPSATPVWHVQLQYEIPEVYPAPPRRTQPTVRRRAKTLPRKPRFEAEGIRPKNKALTSDVFVDAKSGKIVQVP